MKTQAKPNSSKVLPYLEDWESNKGQDNNTQQENGLQITALNTPSYTQITPSYTPVYHTIQIPSNNSLISNLNQPSYHYPTNDDDKTPSTMLSEKTFSAPKEPKKKIKNHSPFNPRRPFTSLCQNILSIKCCHIKGKNVRKFLACSILLCVLANLALIIYLAVYHFHKKDINLTSVAGALSYIAYNLDAHPILDIRVQNEKSSCPPDYYSIVLGTWPGTTAGCDCPGGLKSEVCDKSENGTDLLCDDIAPRKPIDMYDWGGSKWCVNRAKLGSEYNKTVECAEGFRKCSAGICVLETLSCPVTKVGIQSTGTYKLKIGTDRYVVTEISPGESPVIDLDIAPNDIPCFSADYFAAGPVPPYILINEDESGCSKYGLDDKYSFQLDKQKQKKLFDQNDFPSKVYDLPDYASIFGRTDSVLSYRRRLSLAEKDFCLNIDTAILEKSSKAAKDLQRFMSGTLIAAIILHAILFLTISVLVCIVGSKASFSDFLKGEDSLAWICPYLFLGCVELIDLIVMFAATTYYRAKMMGTQDYFMDLTAKGCFLDLQTQSAVSDYQIVVDVVAGTLFKYSLTLFSIGTFVVFACGYLLWKNRG